MNFSFIFFSQRILLFFGKYRLVPVLRLATRQKLIIIHIGYDVWLEVKRLTDLLQK